MPIAYHGKKQKEQQEPTDRERLRRKPHCEYCMSRIGNWIHSCAPPVSCQPGKPIRSLVPLRVRFLRCERNLITLVKALRGSSRSHLFPDLNAHAGVFSALTNTSLMPARKLFGPSSSVAFAKASHSPMGVRDPDARIKLVRRSLSFLGTEWHSRTRSNSPD